MQRAQRSDLPHLGVHLVVLVRVCPVEARVPLLVDEQVWVVHLGAVGRGSGWTVGTQLGLVKPRARAGRAHKHARMCIREHHCLGVCVRQTSSAARLLELERDRADERARDRLGGLRAFAERVHRRSQHALFCDASRCAAPAAPGSQRQPAQRGRRVRRWVRSRARTQPHGLGHRRHSEIHHHRIGVSVHHLRGRVGEADTAAIGSA